MKKARFTEQQIVGCPNHGVSPSTFYEWKSKFGGMEAWDVTRARDRG